MRTGFKPLVFATLLALGATFAGGARADSPNRPLIAEARADDLGILHIIGTNFVSSGGFPPIVTLGTARIPLIVTIATPPRSTWCCRRGLRPAAIC